MALSKHIEIDFLKSISDLLRKQEITVVQAKDAGKQFLALLPFKSEEDISLKMKTLVDMYPQLDKFYAIVLTYFDEQRTSEILDKLRFYIHKAE